MMTGPESGTYPPGNPDRPHRPTCSQHGHHVSGEFTGIKDLRAAQVGAEAINGTRPDDVRQPLGDIRDVDRLAARARRDDNDGQARRGCHCHQH
jgi:hypothetical protein